MGLRRVLLQRQEPVAEHGHVRLNLRAEQFQKGRITLHEARGWGEWSREEEMASVPGPIEELPPTITTDYHYNTRSR